jgi:hypothetical protein
MSSIELCEVFRIRDGLSEAYVVRQQHAHSAVGSLIDEHSTSYVVEARNDGVRLSAMKALTWR